jgi:hypothetical protein
VSRILVPVHVPQLGDVRRKHWAKVITAVDSSKASGWAFVGDFVADGGIQDLPVASILLVYGERGSRTNPLGEARLYTVNSDATLTLQAEAQGRAWARTLRDRAEELLGTPPPAPDLSGWSDSELAAEMARRGWTVFPPGSGT